MGAALGLSSPVPPPRRAPVSKRHTLQGTGTAFTRWSDNLYCSGASGQSCRLPNGREVLAGMCHWQKQHAPHRWLPVEEADMNVTNRPTFVGHRWDPLRPHGPRSGESSGESGESGFRHFGRDEASRCLQGKRVLVAGDSTTRDTFYELVTVPPASPLCRAVGSQDSSVARPHPAPGRWPDTAARSCATCRTRAGRTGPTAPTRRATPVGRWPTARAGAWVTTTSASPACVTCTWRGPTAGARRASPSSS